MRRHIKDDRWKKYVDLIETTSRRGAAVTRQLLTFARKNNPHVSRINVMTVIEQTIRLFEVSAPKSINIKCVFSSEPLIVEADDTQLQQAILNLFLNARDAMPEGGVLVITCQGISFDEGHAQQLTDGKAGSYVMITIADSGEGIPPDLLHRIFEPFFTTKEQGKGTGLGLSVVYGVVKSHNGHISVRSEINSGTEFTIYLPRILNGELNTTIERDSSELVGGTERILIIEDEMPVAEIGADILRNLGYQVEVSQNGREAIDRLIADTQPFHLIILDMNMPRMGGRATFDQIKKLFPSMKVLVCSGYSATMLDDGKFAEAIDGFIQKPYELADFAQKVRTILDERVSASSLHP
ncbi:MAG: response regulator [Ignavibacteriales bacterium]|nr:response regulator [Ignavibacteriales bacterium]